MLISFLSDFNDSWINDRFLWQLSPLCLFLNKPHLFDKCWLTNLVELIDISQDSFSFHHFVFYRQLVRKLDFKVYSSDANIPKKISGFMRNKMGVEQTL